MTPIMKVTVAQVFARQLPIVVPNASNDGGRRGGRGLRPPVPIDQIVHHRLVLYASVFDLTSRTGKPGVPVANPIFQWCSRFGALPFVLAVGGWQEWDAMLASVTVGRKRPECAMGFPTPDLVDYLDIGFNGREDDGPVRNGLFLTHNGLVRKIWRASRVDPLEPHDFSILP